MARINFEQTSAQTAGTFCGVGADSGDLPGLLGPINACYTLTGSLFSVARCSRTTSHPTPCSTQDRASVHSHQGDSQAFTSYNLCLQRHRNRPSNAKCPLRNVQGWRGGRTASCCTYPCPEPARLPDSISVFFIQHFNRRSKRLSVGQHCQGSF